ncbi:PREDICTED: MARVEL domain-containing protein 2 isoform X3 [Galeopterus variegatus]|uniref:MARVEL domain-containing protein 2 isoform X3 n=1 Tax=Galeopterus variegatus TaxID=482537 RepID=A0ABM0QZS7_GALVR|nr:PREDICTED: MARVEL domain-containing protein 2 isoform X3 [Galeopterus variegatus]
MSSNEGRSKNQDRHYDKVPGDLPYQDGTIRTLQTLQDSELAVSADPLPPPPLPLQPPFGPDFYSSDTEEPAIAPDLKPVRRFVPDSWKNFFRGKKKDPEWDKPVSDIRYISDGVECSPPASPANHRSPPDSCKDPYRGSEGTFSSQKEADAMLPRDPYGSLGRHTQTARTYSEKVEEYNLRYSYMKSWAGLLRILGVVELLLGAGVFACVTAYIHKDNEWYNLFGYSQPYSMGGSLGSTALVCLKLWRHEAARRHREFLEQQEISEPSLPSKRKMCEMASGGDRQRDSEVNFKELRTIKMKPELLSGHIPPGHIPKPIVMPDYVAKYPVIHTDDERERYKAVFQDQFSEYKELSAEVQAVLRKFDELDAVMSRLPCRSENRQEHERISRIHEEFKKKKNDPTFLEKKERCDYLKNKLSHIKQRIQEYDKVMNWDVQDYS